MAGIIDPILSHKVKVPCVVSVQVSRARPGSRWKCSFPTCPCLSLLLAMLPNLSNILLHQVKQI